MKIYFGNANYNPHLFEGARVHIGEVVTGLVDRGVGVMVNRESPVPAVPRLGGGRIQPLKDLLSCDFGYFRMQGYVPPLGRPLDSPRLRKALALPLVWEINAINHVVGGVADQLEVPGPEALREVYGEAASGIHAAICNTEGLAQFARDIGIPNVRRIPLAANPSLFCPRSDIPGVVRALRRKLNVVWIGSAGIRWHDFPCMLRAAERLASHPDIRFFLIGSDPNVSLPDNVLSLGQRSYLEMARYLSGMDVGLAIYKRPLNPRYGVFSSPLKLFDYMACALPVIASPIEQVVECLGDGAAGVIVDYDDDAALADRIVQMLEMGPEGRARLGAAARRSVESYYNWARVARETDEFLRSLAGPRNAAAGPGHRMLSLLCRLHGGLVRRDG